MDRSIHKQSWLWIACVGIGLIVVVLICVLLITQHRASNYPVALETSNPRTDTPTVFPVVEPAETVVDSPPQLPRLDFAPGSVEEACGFNELPTYSFSDVYDTIVEKTRDHAKVLESDECRVALEAQMSASNPQHFLVSGLPYSFSLAELVVLEPPLTFERVFSDPTGDLLRVQDALSRSECLLTGDETNWELQETCHADALLNFAFVNLFCFGEGIENRIRPVDREKDYSNPYHEHPTPEEDRMLWKQDLEDSWVVAKCEALDPTLDFTTEHHPELHALVMSWRNVPENSFSKGAVTLLVELAARLGDEAAGLSQTDFSLDTIGDNFRGEGYVYGRINNLVGNGQWSWVFKEEPSADRLLEAFHVLARLDSPKSDHRDEIDFDWELVTRHLCEPPYFEETSFSGPKLVEDVEHSSCKEIVHEIRQQRGIKSPTVLATIDKFEQVALELGVYE